MSIEAGAKLQVAQVHKIFRWDLPVSGRTLVIGETYVIGKEIGGKIRGVQVGYNDNDLPTIKEVALKQLNAVISTVQPRWVTVGEEIKIDGPIEIIDYKKRRFRVTLV